MVMNPNGPLLQGRWLWYGNEGQHYSHGNDFGEWDRRFATASAWGMTGVHVKMAEGTQRWYSLTQYEIFKTLAKKHNLQVSPYHYVYGNTFGNHLYAEAAIEAELGNAFGSVVPDMEDQWFNQTGWADAFGPAIRAAGYHGPIFPSVYANPSSHPFPYVQCNRWAAAFLPQVYFVQWSDAHSGWWGAEQAVNYVYPQWLALDARCKAETHIGLKPMLPDIQVGKDDAHPEHVLSTNEIHNWLVMMGGYGYCGFWYELEYDPYAAVVKASPFPQIKHAVVVPPSVQQHPAHQPPSSPSSPSSSHTSPPPPPPTPTTTHPPSSPLVQHPGTVVQQPSGVSGVQKPPQLVPISPSSLGKTVLGSVVAVEEIPTVHIPVTPATGTPIVLPPLPSQPLLPSSPSSPPPPLSSSSPSSQSASTLLEHLAGGGGQSSPSAPPISLPSSEPGTSAPVGERDVTPTDPSLPLTTVGVTLPPPPPSLQPEEKGEGGGTTVLPSSPVPLSREEKGGAAEGQEPWFIGSSAPLISEVELQAMWHWEVPSLSWDPQDPITARWIALVEEGVSFRVIGAPLHTPQQKVVGSETITYITFKSGCQILHFEGDPVARVL